MRRRNFRDTRALDVRSFLYAFPAHASLREPPPISGLAYARPKHKRSPISGLSRAQSAKPPRPREEVRSPAKQPPNHPPAESANSGHPQAALVASSSPLQKTQRVTRSAIRCAAVSGGGIRELSCTTAHRQRARRTVQVRSLLKNDASRAPLRLKQENVAPAPATL